MALRWWTVLGALAACSVVILVQETLFMGHLSSLHVGSGPARPSGAHALRHDAAGTRDWQVRPLLVEGGGHAPPPGYASTPARLSRSGALGFERELSKCAKMDGPRPGWSLEASIGRGGAEGKCPGRRVTLTTFVCGAKCAARDAEQEHTFGILGMNRFNLHGLLRLCKAGAFPFLVWIKDNEVLHRPCQPSPTAKHVFAASMRLLRTVACVVRLPNTVFGFDGNDYAIPQVHSPLKFASSGWIHPLPGVLRLVGTDASPTALFPTPPFVSAMGLGHYMSFERPSFFAKAAAAPDSAEEEARWQGRSEDIFWRGGTTGIPFDYDYAYMMPRPQLVRLMKDKTGFDVGFTAFDGVGDKMRAAGFMETTRRVSYARASDFQHHRYHVHLDGNTASWGLMNKLTMHAVILWQPSPVTFREHYYAKLKPWVHYVPVDADLANLEQIRDWLDTPNGHAEARAIRDRQASLVRASLRPEDLVCYVVRLVHSNARLQDFEADEATMDLVGREFDIFSHSFKPFH